MRHDELPISATTRSETGQTRPHVLLVDDQAFFVGFARDLLAATGYELQAMCSGEEALALARASRPDGILLDLNMPGVDRPETCRRLTANPTTTAVPAAFLAPTLDTNVKARAWEAATEPRVTQ